MQRECYSGVTFTHSLYIYIYIHIHIYTGLFRMIVRAQLSSGNSAPNSGNNHHLTIPFEGGMHSFKRQGACSPELKVRIRTAIGTITADMLQTVWNELDYHVDVCRITKGAHIEYL